MSVDPHTEQKLLELIYDLLPEAEAAELRSRIASDPALAEAYAQAQTAAGLFAEAARLQAPKLSLAALKAAVASGPAAAVPASLVVSAPSAPMSGGGTTTTAPRKTVDASRRARTKWAHLVVALAASLLLAISLGGYLYHRGQLAEIAAEHLRVIVVGPSVVQAGAPVEFHVQATSVTGDPVTAQVELTLYSGDGKRVWAHHQKCDDDGRLIVGIPEEKLPPRARLEVLAVHRDKFERFDMPLVVEPAQYLARVSTDRSEYKPGEVVHCRAAAMSRWGQLPEQPVAVRFQLLDSSGKLMCETPLETITTRGVAADALPLPRSLPSGSYLLTVCSGHGDVVPGGKWLKIAAGDAGGAGSGGHNSSPQDVQALPAESALASAPTVSQASVSDRGSTSASPDASSEQPPAKATDEASASQVVVQFFPEGGALAPGVENRVYLRASTADGKPVRIAGQIVDSADNRLAHVQTGDHGLGRFSITPLVGQQYRLKIEAPQQPDVRIPVPTAMVDQTVAISLVQGVVDAGSPLEFTVRASKPGMPLVAAAYSGDALIAQQPIATDGRQSATVSAVMPLPAQASGIIRLVLFDFSTAPPRPAAERLAYRRPSRWVDVQLAGLQKHYQPGQTVEIAVQTTNEKGQRIPAVIGISAVAEHRRGSGTPAADGASENHLSLLAELLNGAGLADGKQLVNADRLLAESSAARETFELLLGTQPTVFLKTAAVLAESTQPAQGGETQVIKSGLAAPLSSAVTARGIAQCRPPALYDNLKRLHEQYDARLRQYHADRTRLLNTLTTASFFGGLGLVLLVAMLGVLRIVSGWHLWAPAVGATVCSLIIGAVLIDPSRLRPDDHQLVAFASYQPSAEIRPGQDDGRGELKADQPGDTKQERDISAAALSAEREHGKPAGQGGSAPFDSLALRKAASNALPPAPGVEKNRNGDGVKAAPSEKQLPALADRAQGNLQAGGKPTDKPTGQIPAPVPAPPSQQPGGEGRRNAAPQAEPQKASASPEALARRAVGRAAKSTPAKQAEQTVFWHPLLDTGAEGRTTVAFRLPDRPGIVRVRIDAQCQGRLGGAEVEIVVSAPPESANSRTGEAQE